MVVLGAIDSPVGMKYRWCSQYPTAGDLTRTSRIHIPNLYLKYWWFKNRPDVVGVPFTVSRTWLVNEGRSLGHEFGHSCSLLHNFNCSNNLMTQSGGTRNTLTLTQVGAMHRHLSISNLRQFIDCTERYDTPNYSATRAVTAPDEVWDLNVRLYSSVVVKTGARLTLTCNLLLPYDGKITVERGAKLIVDGGTVTRANTCDPSQHWRGIYVQGNSSQPQASPFSFPAATSSGIVVFQNNALIEGAVVGAATAKSETELSNGAYWGGVIYSDGATFRDCRKGAEFMQYHFPNLGDFKNTTFERTGSGSSYAGVTIWDTDGIDFETCTFDGMTQNGIRAGDAVFNVTKGCQFSGSDMAILTGAASPLSNDIRIGEMGSTVANRNKFFNNTIGIRAMANTRLLVYSNDFEDYDFDVAIVGASNNELRENHFTGTTTGNQFETVGLSPNLNRCNFYLNTALGTNLIGDNRGWTLTNEDFTTNTYDLLLEGPSNNPGRIATNQGGGGAAKYNFFSLNKPENIKTSTVPPNNNTIFFRYFHPNSVIDVRLKPKCGLTESCTPASVFFNIQTTGDNNEVCVQTPPPAETPCETRPCLEAVRTALAQKRALLEQGDSPMHFTALQTNGGSAATYDQLLAASPYLSDALLRAVADNGAMNTHYKEQLFSANTPLTASVLDYLPGKISQSALLNLQNASANYAVSARAQLEAEIENLTTQREGITDALIREYRIAGNWDMIETLLNEDLNPLNRRRLFGAKVEQQDYVAAAAVLQNFPIASTDDQYFLQVQNINLARLNAGLGYELSSGDNALLTQIAVSGEASAGYAQSLLMMLTGEIIRPKMPDLAGERSTWQQANHIVATENESDFFILSPNPANDFLSIRLLLPPAEATQCRIEIYDLPTGRLVQSHDLPGSDTVFLSVEQLPQGLYQITLCRQGRCIDRQKLLIQH